MQPLLRSFVLLVLGMAGLGESVAQTNPDFVVPASGKPHSTHGKRAFHTNYIVYHGAWNHRSVDDSNEPLALHGPFQGSIEGYHPTDLRTAYSIPAGLGTRAIALIDAYHLATNLSDFNTFSREFGLPVETSTVSTNSTNKVFQVVYPTGSQPAANGDWGAEIAIDMEWAHALAPNAKIYLVECASDAESDLFAGVQYVNSHLPDVGYVSMSFGGSEDSSEISSDSIFTAPYVTYLSASGDVPNTVSYPATSPNVVAVGGTSLNLSGGAVKSETYWYSDGEDGGSAGDSAYEERPSYQAQEASIVGTFRGTNDIAAVADPSTGCAVYDSTPIPSDKGVSGWLVFGGTSLACPVCAGILSDRGYSQATSFSNIAQLYSLAGTSYCRDITSGSNGVQSAKAGYDFVTGVGSPVGVYVNHAFSLSRGSLITGTPLVGQPGNMVAKDNHPYEVRSVQDGADQVAAVGATFTGTISSGTALGGTVTVTGTCGATTTAVYALNLGTSNFDFIGTIPLGQTSTTTTLSTSSLANYVSSTGVIQFEVVASNTGSVPMRLSVDQITFSAGSLK